MDTIPEGAGRAVLPNDHRRFRTAVVVGVVFPPIITSDLNTEGPRGDRSGVPFAIAVSGRGTVVGVILRHDETGVPKKGREKTRERKGRVAKEREREGTRNLSILRPQG